MAKVRTAGTLRAIFALKGVLIMWAIGPLRGIVAMKMIVRRVAPTMKMIIAMSRSKSIEARCTIEARDDIKPPVAAGNVEVAGAAVKAKDDQRCPII